MCGDVLLNGTVQTEAQHFVVAAAVQPVAAVSIVRNLLDVALPNYDYGDEAALAEFANEALTAAGVRARATST